jgi:hypothetical protein
LIAQRRLNEEISCSPTLNGSPNSGAHAGEYAYVNGVGAVSAIRAGGSHKKMLMPKWLRVLMEDAERYLDVDRLI